MLIDWTDGIERSPTGGPLREIVQPDAWSSTLWISPDGGEGGLEGGGG